MKFEDSILNDIKKALGVDVETTGFDTELCMYINDAIGTLNQNGIGQFIVVEDSTLTWDDFRNPEQTTGNMYFKMIPLYITLSTKLMFDPPPPSSVEYHKEQLDTSLWRLKVFYEMRLV